MRDPATGNIHLFVVNQSLTDSATLSGFENWNVVSWKQIKSAKYSDGDTVGVSGPEPIQMQSVTLPLAGVALAIAPVSVNHIVLAASSNAGNVVPISSIKATGNSMTINWTSTPGKIYRVAYKSSISDATWTDSGGNITATGTTTTWTDGAGNKFLQRYYTVYVAN